MTERPATAHAPTLPAAARHAVWRAAIAAEGLLGVPADVEWALPGDHEAAQVWVLQARPITTLPA